MSSTSTVATDSSQRPTPKTPLMKRISVAIQRRSGVIKGVSIVLIVIALFVIVRALPVDRAIDLLKSKVHGLGFWGPLALGAAYVVAALAFFPGSALTLTAGAVFGLARGTTIVSLASTTAAALAFLIVRYLVRDKVAKQAQRYPKFKAIDGAIGAGGWKIIAMLRLSPAMPFSLGNYLFGLTAIRFWPYILASWLFMLPGTFMFVYLGHIGTEGLRAGAELGKTPAEWALLGAGLLATVAVSVYVARLSLNALGELTRIEKQMAETEQPSKSAAQNATVATDWPWGMTLLATVAIAMLAVAAYTHQRRDIPRNLFGPAPVTLQEAYQHQSDGPTFDHSAFDALLRNHVDDDEWVDYKGFRKDATTLDSYIVSTLSSVGAMRTPPEPFVGNA